MKSIFLRGSKIKRITALVLVAIMTAVPFFAHAGLPGGSKAEEIEKVSYTQYDIGLSNGGTYGIKNNGGIFTITNSAGSDFPVKTATYYYDFNYVKVTVNGSSISSTEPLLDANFEVQENIVATDYIATFESDVYYQKTGDTDYKKLSDEPITVTGNCVYNFFLKPYIAEKDGVQVNSADYINVAQITFTGNDLSAMEAPKFQHNGSDIHENEYYKNATLKYPDMIVSPSGSLQKIKYGYKTSDGTFTECSDGTAINTTGTYTPCVEYSLPDENGNDSVIKAIEGTAVNIDATAPSVKLIFIEVNSEGQQVSDKTPAEYDNPASGITVDLAKPEAGNHYKLKITGNDNDSGIDTISLTVDGNTTTQNADNTGSYTFDNIEKKTYSYQVTDKAGNSTTAATITVDYDEEKPSVSGVEAKINGVSVLDGSDTYYKGVPVISATVTDNKSIKEVTLYYKKSADGTYNSKVTENVNSTSYTYSQTLDSLDVGTYEFYIVAEDAAGNKSDATDIKTFKIDNKAPELVTPTYWYRTKNSDGSTWGAWKSWGPASDNKFYLNSALMGAGEIEYSVELKVKDENSGLDSATKTTGNGSLTRETVGVGDTDEHIYRYTFGDDSNSGVKIDFVDKAISNTSPANTPNMTSFEIAADKLETANDTIIFDSASLKIYEKGNDGNSVSVNNITNTIYINKTYVVSIDALTIYNIYNAKLTASLPDASDLEIAGKANISETEFDASTGRKRTTITYDVPGSALLDINTKLENITLYVTDVRNAPNPTGTDDTATETISDILYDISRPALESTNADNDWHQSFTLTYEIVSNPFATDEPESGLAWIKYDVGNTSDSSSDVEVQNSLNPENCYKYIGSISVPESTSIAGTKYVFKAQDWAKNDIYDVEGANVINVKVDKHKPDISLLSVNGNTTHTAPYTGQPIIKAVANDNLTLDKVVIRVEYPDGTVKETINNINREAVDITENTTYTIERINGKVLDGTYKVTAYAVDMSGRSSQSVSNIFTVDNKKPVVTANVVGGTASPKTTSPYYYKDNVKIELTYQDDNISQQNVVVTDNGNTIGTSWSQVSGTSNKFVAYVTLSTEGNHNLVINAKDNAGNVADTKNQTLTIDKTKPTVSAYVNDTIAYNENMGSLILTGNATVSMNVGDATFDANDNYIQIQKNVPNQPESNPGYSRTSNTYMTFSDEADYVVNFYSVDKANNPSDVKTVRFRIDKTAPELSISGIGATSTGATNVTFTMREAFWWDANATVTIYRKAGDGASEELYKTLTFRPTAYQTAMSDTLTETGAYRFEFEASDNAGHRSSRSQTLVIDRNAPVVNLTGVADYDKTESAVEFYVEISDEFYLSKKVNISGTRKDLYGTMHKLQFGNISQSTNPTIISQNFEEDGIYDIALVTSDIAGNEQVNNIHFVIDSQDPVIADLSKYDGKIFKSFSLDDDIDDLVSDLTVCEIQMYLNGSEYDGKSYIDDGSYVLRIVATDEVGHTSEKEVMFEIDTKAPVFIVTGVEDGEVKSEDYVINISLQLDEDTLESVTLNGKNISINNNTATINVTEKGNYELELKAHDAAGNEASMIIHFTHGKKMLWWILLVGILFVLLTVIIVTVIARNKKDK